MARLLSEIRQAVQQILRSEYVAGESQDWEDSEIDEAIAECLTELSDYRPYIVIEAVPTTVDVKVIDLAGISGLRRVTRLEYPVGTVPRDFRNFVHIDDERVEIDTTRTPSAGESGTLTGTLTFTAGSTAVTGSGTDFDGELEAKNMIRVSTGSRWYRVASITDDTNLVLAEPCSTEDAGADTAGATKYCTEACLVYCEKDHILTEEKSSLPPQMERIIIEGAVANCAENWINTARTQIASAIDAVSQVKSSVDQMSNRIAQALIDLENGRAYIAYKMTEANTAVTTGATELAQAITDLDNGRALIGDKRTEAIAAIGKVTDGIDQAVADLASGRALVGDKREDALTALTTMGTELGQAITDLDSSRALVADKRTEAITAIDKVAAEVAQAITDLDSGRTYIDDERTTADNAIDAVTEQINQAQADLAAGRTLINKVNIGQNPESDYSNFAARDLQLASQLLNQASAYMSESSTSARFAQYAYTGLSNAKGYIEEAKAYMALDQQAMEHTNNAVAQMRAAQTYMSQANAYLNMDAPAVRHQQNAVVELQQARARIDEAMSYMALDRETAEHADYASRQMQVGRDYLNQARAYMSMDAPAGEYAASAARELQAANTYLAQATGYIRELTGRLNITNSINAYKRWADDKLAIYKAQLPRLYRPRTKRQYAKS